MMPESLLEPFLDKEIPQVPMDRMMCPGFEQILQPAPRPVSQ
jgi:hypothetical protein